MNRMTYKNKFNRWEANGNHTNFALGYDDEPARVRGDIIDKLAEYEDEAEQREKGCECCRNEKAIYSCCYGTRIYVEDLNSNYCSNCGRKLGD